MNYWIEFLFEFLVSDFVLEVLVSDFARLILVPDFCLICVPDFFTRFFTRFYDGDLARSFCTAFESAI